MFPDHVLVNLLAPLDLGDQLPSRLGEVAEKSFIPHLRVRIAASGASSGTDTDENAYFPSWPLVHHGLVQGFGTGVESANTVVMEDRLADLNWLESEANRAGCATGLPDLAVEFGGWLASGVVGSENGGRRAPRRSLVHSSNSADAVVSNTIYNSGQSGLVWRETHVLVRFSRESYNLALGSPCLELMDGRDIWAAGLRALKLTTLALLAWRLGAALE